MWEYVYPDELYHHGVKGMKWGKRLYQNKDGSLTPLGRIRYGYKQKQTEKKRKENLAKARAAKVAKKQAAEDEAKKQQEKAAEKERILKTGTASEILAIKGDLTPAEMQSATTRLKWEDDMRRYSQAEISAGKEKTDKFFKNMDDVVNKAQTAAKFYNTAANVINAFNGEKVMPKIDTNITNGNKDQVNKRRKDKAKAKEAEEKRKQQEAEGDAKRAERAKKKAEQAKQESNNQKNNQNQQKSESKTNTQNDKKSAKTEQPKTERYEATGDDVFGEGTSRSNIKNDSKWQDFMGTNKKASNYYDPIDSVASDYYDDPVSNLPAVYTNRGELAVRRFFD